MTWTIIFPPSGGDPILYRDGYRIGSLEPCDLSDLETDVLVWRAKHRVSPEPGTTIRLSSRTFACFRETITSYFHLS